MFTLGRVVLPSTVPLIFKTKLESCMMIISSNDELNWTRKSAIWHVCGLHSDHASFHWISRKSTELKCFQNIKAFYRFKPNKVHSHLP